MRKPLVLVVVVGLALTAAAAFAAPTSVPLKTAGGADGRLRRSGAGVLERQSDGDDDQEPDRLRGAARAGDREEPRASRKVVFVRAPFGGLFSPSSKPYDFAMEEATITIARSKVVSFSAPYFDANQGVLIRKGLAKPTSIAALKSLQLCAQADTTGLSYIQHTLRPAKQALVYNASSTAAFDAVEAGKCDALILDVPIVVAQSQKKPGAYGGVVGQIVTHEGYGAIMEKGSALKPSIDKAIKALKANGTIGKLQRKWLPFTRVPVLK